MLITIETWKKICGLSASQILYLVIETDLFTGVALLTCFRITKEEQNQRELYAFHFPDSEFGLHPA